MMNSPQARTPKKGRIVLTTDPNHPNAHKIGVFTAGKGKPEIPKGAVVREIRVKSKEEAEQLLKRMREQRGQIHSEYEKSEFPERTGNEMQIDLDDALDESFMEEAQFDESIADDLFSDDESHEKTGEAVQEVVWSTASYRTTDGDKETTQEDLRSMAKSEETKPKVFGKKTSYVMADEAKKLSTYTEEVEQWVNDIVNDIEGVGALRVIVSPSIRAREYMAPVGFGIAVFSSPTETNTLVLPMDLYDPFRMYSGIYAIRIPRDLTHKAFYEAVSKLGPAGTKKAMTEARNKASFQLRESFLGIFAERSAKTLWASMFWIVVRDGDVEASENLFSILEEHSDLPFIEQMQKAPLQETREASERRRKEMALLVYNTILESAESTAVEEIQGDHETEVTHYAVHMISSESALVVSNSMSPVNGRKRHILLSSFTDGLTIFEGQESGDEWRADSGLIFLMPCETGEMDENEEPPDGMEHIFDGPKDYPHSVPRSYAWKQVEPVYGRGYGMSEKILEPIFIAGSHFEGHALESSDYNNLR